METVTKTKTESPLPDRAIAAEGSVETNATNTHKPVSPKRKIPIRAAAALGAIALIFGTLLFVHSLHTVSTDDAYVNSHVTFVAPRVAGQVLKVLVDDNYRVKKGDVLLEIDPEPFRVAVEMKQAALDGAQANLIVATASTRALIAQTRGARFQLSHAMEMVDDEIAEVRQRVAALEREQASLVLAEANFKRAEDLLDKKVISQEEFDHQKEVFDVARAQVAESLQDVYQSRVALGLPAEAPAGRSLTDVPPNLDQTFSTVREALAGLIQDAAQLGIAPSSFDASPDHVISEFLSRDPDGNVDRIYADVLENAPAIQQARATVEQAQKELDRAKLDLGYCTIVARIDGVVTRRNANPGDYVQVGQSLMAVRSLDDIWVDANFKETQLRDLRIGQKVALHVDMYGSRHVFEGRISGFAMGTGSTLALLPPENATGNFVKVVQRLPVRIDIIDYDPDKWPLFVGTSVEPQVDLRSEPTGPNAGRYLQNPATLPMAGPR